MTTDQRPQNPFALLRISTRASHKEVVEQVKILSNEANDPNAKLLYRSAKDQLTHPFDKLVQTVWEMPDTDYAEQDETWHNFVKAFRSNPIMSNNLSQLANAFVKENFHPDKLLTLLSPLLKISRPTEKHIFTLDPPVNDDLHYPLNSSELF